MSEMIETTPMWSPSLMASDARGRAAAKRRAAAERTSVFVEMIAIILAFAACAVLTFGAAVRKAFVALALVGLVGLAGCSATSAAQVEETAHKALVATEQSLNWLQANPDLLNAALDDLATKAAGHPAAEGAVARARAAVAAGDLALAWSFIHAGVLLTAPAPAPSSGK